MEKRLIETWQIHNRINLYLLDEIASDECLADLPPSKGRNVGDQTAHMHNVRLMWIKEAAPELMDDLQKIERGEFRNRAYLKEHLIRSGEKVELMLKKAIDEDRLKGFKPHPIAYLGYIISQESHHRGQIVLTLKMAGHSISKKAGFGLWQWGTR